MLEYEERLSEMDVIDYDAAILDGGDVQFTFTFDRTEPITFIVSRRSLPLLHDPMEYVIMILKQKTEKRRRG